MAQVKKAILQYNLEDELTMRYGHKLRGFFSNKFKNILFHNHKSNGKFRYAYPLIQYKIIEGKPTVLGLGEGATLITKNFLDIDKLILGTSEYNNPEARLEVEDIRLGNNSAEEMYNYRFISPWLGLNQRNHSTYINEIKNSSEDEQYKFLTKILVGNILTFAKGVNWWLEDKIVVTHNVKSVDVKFKNKDMIGFVGEFTSNIQLPNYIGLGKSTARGFGTVKRG